MWPSRLLCVGIVAASCGIAGSDLQKEDLRSIQQAFRKKDPALDWFEAEAKRSIDVTRSIMIVSADQTEQRPVGPQGVLRCCPVPGAARDGVFIVTGTSNRVLLVLEISSDETKGLPVIGQPEVDSVSLHFYDDYGMYEESIKYFYNLVSRKPPLRFRYGMLALTSSKIRNERLVYSGSSLDRALQLEIDPQPDGVLPAYKIADLPTGESESSPKPASLRLSDGRLLEVSNTPPGQSHQLAGFAVTQQSGTRELYRVPVPTIAMYRRLRPRDENPNEIENDIGPIVRNGSTIWFANTFYDGEGVSGVGAIGSFDVRTHRFTMRHLPQIAAWSGSAIALDGDNLWIGLMRQPEGAAFGGGLLRYNIQTGAIEKFEIPDYIHTIDRLGDTIYCGTSDGIYSVRGDNVRHMRFDPDATGKIIMVTKPK